MEQDLELHTKKRKRIRKRTQCVRVCTVARLNAAIAHWECVVGVWGVLAPKVSVVVYAGRRV